MTDRIRALADADLRALIAELKTSTRLEQSMLAAALAEKRRRGRKPKVEVTDG